jgi:glucose/mannose-6-phosphate isomerase
VTILEDEAALRSGDPSGLLDSILSLPDQLASSFRAASQQGGTPPGMRSITFCGMGGSAAAGDVVAAQYREHLDIPIGTVRGYSLPRYCGQDDVVICLSYSGNTEETVSAYREATERGCRVVAVCSGGELADLAERDGALLVRVPGEMPAPRAALGHLVGAVIGALSSADFEWVDEVVEGAVGVLEDLSEKLGRDVPIGRNSAKHIAEWLEDRVPVIWSSEGPSEPAGWRWKCAFNENAKLPAFASSLPELDHHEVVGWSGTWGERFALLVLRHVDEHSSVDRRLEATIEVVGESGLAWHAAHARGTSPLDQVLSLMMIGDAASIYHALEHGIDPTPIEAIDRIKARMA